MSFQPDERVAVFIDGSNLYATAKLLDFDIDYGRLLASFKSNTKWVRANYYTAIFEQDDFSPLRPLLDWLDYNGYHVITKPAREYTDREGRRKIKGNMDMEIAVDMIELAPNIDHIVLVSGDGDFRRVVDFVQRKGVRVTVLSTLKSKPPMLSDELRRQADHVIDLCDLEPQISREFFDDYEDDE